MTPKTAQEIAAKTWRDETARMMAAAILSSHEMILPENKEKLADIAYKYADALIEKGEKLKSEGGK